MSNEKRGRHAAHDLFRIELTLKALLGIVKIELLKHKGPIIRVKENLGLGCGICDLTINFQISAKNDAIAMCTECGQLYHKECIEEVKEHVPITRCSNRNCNGRLNNLLLLNTIKWIR